MGEVVYLERRAVGVRGTRRSLRQPGACVNPAPQFVSLGDALDNLLAKIEARMVENGVTKP